MVTFSKRVTRFSIPKGPTMQFFVVIMIIGGIFSFMSYSDAQLQGVLKKEGVVTAGTITSVETSRGRRGRKSHKMMVTYLPEGTAPVSKQFSVSSSFFVNHVSGETVVQNPACEVKYAKSNPDQAIIVGGTSDSSWMLWPSVGGFGIGLVGSVVMGARRIANRVSG